MINPSYEGEPHFQLPAYRGRHFYYLAIDWIALIYAVDAFVKDGRVWRQSFKIYRQDLGDDWWQQ